MVNHINKNPKDFGKSSMGTNKSIQIEFVTVKPNSGSNGDIAVDNIRIHSLALTVPTLGEWGIITLFLLLLIVAISTIRGFAAKGCISAVS